jgi:hypothetical protein
MVCQPALAQYEDDNGTLIEPVLLTDPFLQLPTADSVNVVWFTEFEGSGHVVTLENGRVIEATTTKLSRTREDSDSWVFRGEERNIIFDTPVQRNIWRHEAIVTELAAGERVGYTVTSVFPDGTEITSDGFTLTPLPLAGTPLKILLTSDHQNMPMTPANIQKVVETVGQVDAVFMAGDLVNETDRACEWFDYGDGGGFFKSLQGNAELVLEWDESGTVYTGGALIQSAPMFTAIGNHEVMGRFSMNGGSIADQFNLPRPVAAAAALYEQNAALINPNNDPTIRERFIRDNSFNTITYEEILTMPSNSPGGETYYSVQFGDVYLITLYATRIWRTGRVGPNALSKYAEPTFDSENPGSWGYGEFIFEPINKGSEQYNWLVDELNSEAFKNAKYKVVMLHHPLHALGGNVVPAYTDPVQFIERDDDGNIVRVRYEYPIEKDYLLNDVQPLLQEAGVDLVFFGHSHLWNRFVDEFGVHYLETSNVGNSYDAFTPDTAKRRSIPSDLSAYDAVNYVATGDPYGLEAQMPTIAPLVDENGNPMPFIASDEITVFSILDTGTGVIRSYYFDTTAPESDVVLFDEFTIGGK